jgi:hypothetical protein
MTYHLPPITYRLYADSLDLENCKRVFPVILAKGPHPFPFRTRQLSPSAPMVLRGRPRGRVGRRRGINFEPRTSSWAFLFVSKATQIGSAALPGAPASGPPPSSARSGPTFGRRHSLRERRPRERFAWDNAGNKPLCSFAHRLLREAVPPPGLTRGLKSPFPGRSGVRAGSKRTRYSSLWRNVSH